MKLRVTLALLAIVYLSASVAMAQTIITEFTGTVALTGFPHGGTFQCPGGEPTPGGPAPCSPGSRVHIRGLEFEDAQVATDARVTGTLVVVMNANTDGWTDWGPGSGPIWGTIRLVTGSGVWEGSWTGDRKVTPPEGAAASVRGVMFGTGGSVEGLKVEFQIDFPPPMAFVGTSKGRILAPGGK